jgi:hypothetical protein
MLIPAVLWGMLIGHVAGGWMSRLLTAGVSTTTGEMGGAVAGGFMTGLMLMTAVYRMSNRPMTWAWRITAVLLGGLLLGGSWGLIGGGLGTLIETGNLVSGPGVILMIIGALGALSALRMFVKK